LKSKFLGGCLTDISIKKTESFFPHSHVPLWNALLDAAHENQKTGSMKEKQVQPWIG